MNQKARLITKPAASVTVLVAVFILLDPTKLPSIFLILPFLLIFLTIYWSAIAFFNFAGSERDFLSRFWFRKSKFLGVLFGLLPVWLLVLQSIGQLTLRDTIVTATLFILGYAYIIKTSRQIS
jgi:hypothetical protein